MIQLTEKKNPFGFNKSLKGIGTIMFVGFFLGYMIPLAISSFLGGVTNDQVISIMKSNPYNAKQGEDTLMLKEYFTAYAHNAVIDNQIYKINNSYPNLPSNYKDTIKKLNEAKIRISKVSRIRVTGFLDSKTSIMWPISLTALMIIYFVILPTKSKVNWAQFTVVFLLVGFLYISPTILRTFWKYGRVIYSVYNLEINPTMYFYNLFLDLASIFLLVLIWLKCDDYINNNQKECFSDFTLNGIIDSLNRIKLNYNICQFFTLLLFAVFGFHLYILYGNVFTDGDKRYLFQAIFYNFIYLFTWIIGTTPLYFEFTKWRSFKDKVMFDLATETEMKANGVNVQELRQIIPEYEIASSFNHTITIIFSTLSLIFPLLIKLIHVS